MSASQTIVSKPQIPPAAPLPTAGGDKSILCLSCLNGKVKAQAVSRRQVVGQWEREDLLDTFDDFVELVRMAVRKTGYRGTQVSVVLAHPRLTAQLLETPPVKGWALERFIQRRAGQLKPFDAEAAVSFQMLGKAKQGNAVLVHLLPKPVLNQLVRGCEQAGLHLVEVFPATAVLAGHLPQLPLGGGELALLAAETEGTTTVVVGRKNGEVLFGRALNSGWGQSAERVMVDLHRTTLYVEQQFGQAVGSVWLYGAGASEHVLGMEQMVKVPVKVSPVPRSPFYWIFQGQKLRTESPANLVGPEMRKAPQRRMMLRTTAAIIAVFMLISLLGAAYIEWLVRSQRRALDDLRPRALDLIATRAVWQEKYDLLSQQQEWIRLVTEKNAPPVPNWFLSYLGEVFPEELVLTHFQARRVGDYWAVQMGGGLQPGPHSAPERTLTAGVNALVERLEKGPFRVTLSRAGVDPAAGSPVNGNGARAESWVRGTQFYLEGTMR